MGRQLRRDGVCQVTTAHTCGGPVFGKKTPGCPRCDELLAGAAPVVWRGTEDKCKHCGRRIPSGYFGTCDSCAVTMHHRSERHRSGGCGPVCTFGEW